jgi:CRISPR-associated protein Cmr1
MTARAAQTIAELPPRRARATPAGPTREKLELPLRIVTPVLGGAAVPRTIDEVDVVRVPSIRGQLRFWWRALHAHLHSDPRELYRAESALFGRAADEGGGRSAVEVRISGVTAGGVDRSEVKLSGAQATPGAYALFPARAEADGTPTAPRRWPGTRFTLELLAPTDRLEELANVVRAWILFGGYGSRTRRGLGSLTVEGADRSRWLPNEPTRAEFERLFGRDPFAAAGRPSETPRLAGASLLAGTTQTPKQLGLEGRVLSEAECAWLTALHWLRDFRQGTKTGARVSGEGKPEPARPSISNWPEADKIRHLTGKMTSHPPRHGPDPAWPRAAFGLPIVGQFQKNARNGGTYDEPEPFELTWKDGDGLHNRLASPLIVRAMPLASGKFVPIALWLERAWPFGGEVVPKMGRDVRPGSGAPFDKLLGNGDHAYFPPLAGKTSLREAFLDWLAGRGIRRIAG